MLTSVYSPLSALVANVAQEIQFEQDSNVGQASLQQLSTADIKPTNKKEKSLLPETYTLEDDTVGYFRTIGNNKSCFISGTNWTLTRSELERSESSRSTHCHCLEGYYGIDCGIPAAVWLEATQSNSFDPAELKRRAVPRRIIHGINVNHELDFFEIRLQEIGHLIDVLIVAESNFSAGGDTKPMHLLPELKKGFMIQFQHKIIHVRMDHFPTQGYTDGWFADTYIRDYMGKEGLARIQGIRDDDLFLLLDADEIPNAQVLLFLKLYDDYPEPISLTLRWSVYGYFWKMFEQNEEKPTRIVAVASMRMIHQVYGDKVMSLRRNKVELQPLLTKVLNYITRGYKFQLWNIGGIGHYAGFHCSWCYPPEGIRQKLMDAQKDDKPRWGDYPEKLNLKYISSLIADGSWFDGNKPLRKANQTIEGASFAPQFVLSNAHRFQYLLEAPIM